MGYSIFQDTMVDMTYPKIQEAISCGACALLPVSVVEEHGPHLCTGTDIYLTQTICEKIRQSLIQKGKQALIAPPFYWGINSITNGFTGSFSISPKTMENLLLEILENLSRWGIRNIFFLNFHGDSVHIKAIAEIARQAFSDRKVNAYFITDQQVLNQLGLSEEVPYLIGVTQEYSAMPARTSRQIDIHAGAAETSWMLLDYPTLADETGARQLPPSNLSLKDLREWLRGGEVAKRLTPLGYCGSPADIDLAAVREAEKATVETYAAQISAIL